MNGTEEQMFHVKRPGNERSRRTNVSRETYEKDCPLNPADIRKQAKSQ
jgi:hypothetical protein